VNKTKKKNANIKIQVLVDYTNKTFFNAIQDYLFEIEMQIIPIEEEKDIFQYIERLVRLLFLFQIKFLKNP